MARAENALARLGSARRLAVPELIIRIEQAIDASGLSDLLEPALERLRAHDEALAKTHDDVLALYEEIGGVRRT
jgi:hypothetical protein